MTRTELLDNIIHQDNIIDSRQELFETLVRTIDWDNTLSARKTASFGVPYNYSNMSYPFAEFPKSILGIKSKVDCLLGYESNNCLLNYYHESDSSMGFHSDNIEGLAADTGIAIVSLGSKRTFRFKNGEEVVDFVLETGSFFYMNQLIQKHWKHAVLKSKKPNAQRISLTFRKIKI
jgi:hypothetical protein